MWGTSEADQCVCIFPKMIGKHTKSNLYSTLFPSPLQSLWFYTIMQACQKTLITAEFSKYIPIGLDEARNHAGSNRKETMVVQIAIKELILYIQNDTYLLSQFGSFIVADGWRMKMAIKWCIPNITQHGECSTVFGLVKEQFSDMDFDHMLNQSKGTSYLDLRISFHSDSTKPLLACGGLRSSQSHSAKWGQRKGASITSKCLLSMEGWRWRWMLNPRLTYIQLAGSATALLHQQAHVKLHPSYCLSALI